jgi:hypothetical protein
MAIGRRHVVDISDADATLVLSEVVSRREVMDIRRQCRELPPHVRTLHLDLGGVTRFEGGVLDAVRGVVRDWGRSRQGSYRVEFVSPLLVARLEGHSPVANIMPEAMRLPRAQRLAR